MYSSSEPARILKEPATNQTSKNEGLLKNELYLGLQERRVRGQEYDEFVSKFVQAARKHYPNAYIHL